MTCSVAIEAVVAHPMPARADAAIDDLMTSTPMGASARVGTVPRDAA